MAISAVGGSAIASTVGVTTLTVTYSPTAGNIAMVFFNAAGGVTALVVKDNLGNTLSAGPTVGNCYAFYQQSVPSGVTSYIATWTTAQQCSLGVEEYTGATRVNPTGFTASGTSATGFVTGTITAANNWIVAGAGSVNTMTAQAPTNGRQQTTTSTARLTITDNTGTTVGASVQNTVTLTSALINMVAMEIGGTGTSRANQDVELVAEKRTTSNARVNQNFELVLKRPTSVRPRINQDITLVIKRNRRASVNQDFELVVKKPIPRPLVNQDLALVVHQNAPHVHAIQPFVFVTC